MREHIIPDDADIRMLRYRAWHSIRASQERRRVARPVRDGFSDAMILLAIVATLIVLAVSAVVGADDAPAAPQIAAEHAETARSGVDVAAERILAAWCPRPAAMSRRVCVSWLLVAQCETGGRQYAITARSLRQIRWAYDGSSGYDGALQFSVRTWRGNIGRVDGWRLSWVQRRARARGAYRYAWGAPPAVQMLAADVLRRRPDGGLSHWPICGSRF